MMRKKIQTKPLIKTASKPKPKAKGKPVADPLEGAPPLLRKALITPGRYAAFVDRLGVVRFGRAVFAPNPDERGGWFTFLPPDGGEVVVTPVDVYEQTVPGAEPLQFTGGVQVDDWCVRWVAEDLTAAVAPDPISTPAPDPEPASPGRRLTSEDVADL
jgi:hypothetical protein